jgi:hypothetical protein
LSLCRTSVPDGKVCTNDSGELAVTKFAVEPVSLPFLAVSQLDSNITHLRCGTYQVWQNDLG